MHRHRRPTRPLCGTSSARQRRACAALHRTTACRGRSLPFGYPMAVLSINQRGGFVANVRRYWQPAHVIDATQTIIDGRKHDGYIVDQPCLSGMSGGPVFDVAGNLRGMAVATLTRIIPEMDGDPYVVRNRIVVDSAQLQAFVDQHRASC